jgi:hypothetical protein
MPFGGFCRDADRPIAKYAGDGLSKPLNENVERNALVDRLLVLH